MTVDIPRALWDRLCACAGCSPEACVLDLVEEYVEDREDAAEAARISSAIALGTEPVYTLKEVKEYLGLEGSPVAQREQAVKTSGQAGMREDYSLSRGYSRHAGSASEGQTAGWASQ